jgi:hypothetical protein
VNAYASRTGSAGIAIAGRGSDDDDVTQRRDARQHRRDLRPQRSVDDQRAIFRMRHDRRDLLAQQAHVQRMQHRAHCGHGEVGFEMRLVIPAVGGDAFAALDAERGERRGEGGGPNRNIGEGREVECRAIERADAAGAVDPRAVPQDHLRGERQIHHRRFHAPVLKPAMMQLLASKAGTSCSSLRE